MEDRDIAKFQGCSVTSCSNKISPPREKANYLIRDWCRHKNICPYGKVEREQHPRS